MEKTKDITNTTVTEYINSFYRPLTARLGKLRETAEKDGVPIILRETEEFLSMFLEVIRPQKILEIGTAIGYSSMFFAEKIIMTDAVCPEVISIEKDDNMYCIAKRNITEFGYDEIVKLFQGDGEEVINSIAKTQKEFDLVFIDAAKSHYLRFLKSALPLLKKGGIVIADNTLFQAKVVSDEYDIGGRHKTNIKKLREFNEYCMSEKGFSASVMAIGDGLTIIKLL